MFDNMSHLLAEDEFQDIAAKDQAKIAQANKKTGYKEGVFDGRQRVFQEGFDIGMAEGFRNAFNIGRHQGLALGYNQIENHTQSEVPDLLLAKPTRGQCLICNDKELINKTIPEIIKAQTKHSENVSEALQKKYASITEFLKNSN